MTTVVHEPLPLGLPPAGAALSTLPAIVGRQPRSYAELTRDVAALASRLHDIGVHRGDRVAIWTAKDTHYAEAILATIRAGAAYVPLDGGQPPARAAAIVRDARPVVLVTDGQRLGALASQLDELPPAVLITGAAAAPSFAATRVLSWAESLSRGYTRDLPVAGQDDLAAILYTSGSTGIPKGVQITHRNLSTFVLWARTELDVGAHDVFASHTSFSFDISTFDLFVALSVGAAIWIVPGEQARDVAALAAGFREHNVTVTYCVPSVLHLLASSGALTREAAAGLRYVLFAGEVFPLPQLRSLAGLLPRNARLYNLYGPTETNVCTFYRVRPEDLASDRPLPIGVPVSGADVTVLGQDGQVVREPGAVGELVVSGDCVTPGYWRREAESAVAGHQRGRHATGDLVSYREDGQLVYHGRKDRMVKLSGYRVELGEVEAAALRHPSIAEAAAIVDTSGKSPRLALYYTAPAAAPRLSLIDIKRHCARLLPAYMVPHAAIALSELPRNPNGKTDYRQLAADGLGSGREGTT